MKSKGITVAIMVLLMTPGYGQNNRREERLQQQAEQYQMLVTLVQNGKYEFNGIFAMPQQGRQINLTARDNFLRVDGEQATGHLPYFGVAYGSSGYGTGNGSGGIDFAAAVENYRVEENVKKRKIMISFRVKGERDTYTCRLTVSGKDNVLLSVTSTRKQPISYKGSIKALKTTNDN